ncbi:MAG: magnesium/cobalt transporter CorA [Thermoleophilia bacterium]|nr:magnesium/cobalt transporter CorA [Thermoleophilia bacterium]
MPNLPRIRRASGRAASGSADGDTPAAREPDIQRLEAHGVTWLNIESPTEVEIEWLAQNHRFHPLDLEDVRSRRRQRAKIDEYDDYVFIVLHFPRFDKRTQRLQAAELNLFVADNLVITLPNEHMKALSAMFSRCESREETRRQMMARGSGYLLYAIVDAMFDYCFPILDKIGFKLDALEDEIFEGGGEDIVRDISNVKQEIINYRRIIQPQRPTLRRLEREVHEYAPQDLEIYFDDIVDKNERIWDLLEGYKEVAEALEATNESVITHRSNEIIRVLTVLSALMLPLTLITGFYGMNIDALMFAHHGWLSVLFVVTVMVATAAGLLGWFRHRRWI